MTSKFPIAITDCQKETFDLSPDHGQELTSSSLTDDSEDFHFEHFALQIYLVGHHLSHTPNFERQSRVSGKTFRAHMHGSHKVHGSLQNQRPYLASSFLRFHSQTRGVPTPFCVCICGHQRRRRKSCFRCALEVSHSPTCFQIPSPHGQINHNSSVKQYGSKQQTQLRYHV